VTFSTGEDASRARMELNGVKLTAKYANNKVGKPVRLCKYETRPNQHEVDYRSNLLIKNIAKEVSAHGFYNLFRQFGDIRSCKLVVDYLGNSKGYGYVSFFRVEDSERARTALNERDFNSKILRVNFLEHGRRTEKRRNNIYVKHIPKDNFNDQELSVRLFYLETFFPIWCDKICCSFKRH
jgi:RNA recognition motif-containing protein